MVSANKTSLTPLLFTEVPVPSKNYGNESGMCMDFTDFMNVDFFLYFDTI
jgi:hypothetical protein